MKGMIYQLLILLVLGNICNISAGTYSGGLGTDVDPYQIANLDDLIELSTTSADWGTGRYFIQTAQIDANSTTTLNNGAGFSPIGNIETKFTGSYDGKNNTISNLYINRTNTSNIALFGYTSDATITNLGLLNVNVTGNGCVGGLVGVNYSSIISNSYSTGSVTGDQNVGGLIGNNYIDSTISNSYSTGSVTGNFFVGGLVGDNSTNSSVSYSYSTSNIIGYQYVGGFVGFNQGIISNSYSMGSVTRSSGVSTRFGGFCGYNNENSTIENCYSIGKVYQAVGIIWDFGDLGFLGWDNGGTYTNNFFDSEASGHTSSVGATATTTANMKLQGTFTNWDFSGDSETDWVMSSSNTYRGYPTFRWTDGYSVEPSGSNITSVMNLVWIAENNTRWAGNYTQIADLNMWATPSWDDNKGWTPLGNSGTKFTGSYDGQNNTISNLYINRPTTDEIGLFGNTDGATISNIGLLNVNITGAFRVGGLVGWNYVNSSISNSYSIGSITGDNCVGGLVGWNYGNSSISNSYSICSITGNDYVGGLSGYNTTQSSINNSYSTASVTRSSGTDTNLGGFCGYNQNSTIENCYSTGKVYSSAGIIWDEGSSKDKGFLGSDNGGTNTNNFFDIEASEQTSGVSATAKTTADMKLQGTFTGWDFSNTLIWKIQSGAYISYPYLQAITYDMPGENTLGNPIPGLEKLNSVPTSANSEVTTDEDTDKSFESANFPFTDTDNGDVLTSIQIVILPTKGTLYLDVNSNGEVDTGDTVIQNQEILTADIPKLKFKPIANGYGILTEGKYSYTTFTFKVSDGKAYSSSAYPMTINVNPINDPPEITEDNNPTITPEATIRIGGKIGATVGTWNDAKDNPQQSKK